MIDKKVFRKENIPNFLTIFRILCIPIIITLVLIQTSLTNPIIYEFSVGWSNVAINACHLSAAIIFVIACITDFVDGYVARKYNWVSKFGKFWDPIADKVLTTSMLIALTYLEFIPIYLVLILIVRDLLMGGIRMMAANENVVIPANMWGKAKTFVLMIGIIIVLFVGGTGHDWYHYLIQNILIFISAALSVISLIIYGYQYLKRGELKNEQI